MVRRRPGSVRFDPYRKVQWYDERSLCWRDVQQALPDAELEQAAVRALIEPDVARTQGAIWEGRWRFMRVTPEGRSPLPDRELGDSDEAAEAS